MKKIYTFLAAVIAVMIFGNTANAGRIYVDNQLGWDAIAIYAYQNEADSMFGAWPGAAAAGSETINGVEYLYWDMSGEGDHSIIFNNNGGGSQFDGPLVNVSNNYYFQLKANTFVEVNPESGETPDITMYHIYVDDQSGWGTLSLYAWSDGQPKLFGGWPGASPVETKTIDGVEFKCFEARATEAAYNLIFNNGVGGEGGQFDAATIVVDRDYYFTITATTCTELEMGAVGEIAVDANAPVEYYNFQGVRVANPENGMYIRVQAGKATKVIL